MSDHQELKTITHKATMEVLNELYFNSESAKNCHARCKSMVEIRTARYCKELGCRHAKVLRDACPFSTDCVHSERAWDNGNIPYTDYFIQE